MKETESKEIPTDEGSGSEKKECGKGPKFKKQFGGVEVACWESPQGVYFSLERTYRAKNGDFKKTNFLKLNDLPKAWLALMEAYVKETQKK